MILKVLYTVKSIDGDYGVLVDDNNNENRVAMMILPENINIGSKILYENFEYEILD